MRRRVLLLMIALAVPVLCSAGGHGGVQRGPWGNYEYTFFWDVGEWSLLSPCDFMGGNRPYLDAEWAPWDFCGCYGFGGGWPCWTSDWYCPGWFTYTVWHHYNWSGLAVTKHRSHRRDGTGFQVHVFTPVQMARSHKGTYYRGVIEPGDRSSARTRNWSRHQTGPGIGSVSTAPAPYTSSPSGAQSRKRK